MPTESDRDDLARIIFTATQWAFSQTWEETSEGVRRWARQKADDAMAAGWRKFNQWQWAMLDMALDFAISGSREQGLDEASKQFSDLQAYLSRDAALVDPAGADGGE
jgi:hypothetical protein